MLQRPEICTSLMGQLACIQTFHTKIQAPLVINSGETDYIHVGFFFAGDPHNDANAVGTDAFRTLFVGRIVCTCRQFLLHFKLEMLHILKIT